MIATLLEMLTYQRPHGSPMDLAFCARYIAPLPGAWQDQFGNWHVKVGDNPNHILWSCHTDTVHYDSGRQTVHMDKSGRVMLSNRSKRHHVNCLGADDTAGVYICRELILAGVPGYYVFHYGEERGCQGSGDLARQCPDWLTEHFQIAIAFDRRGKTDVITHQSTGRCCSETFAQSLAAQLNRAPGFAYMPDDGGVYTDTAEYVTLIPECTNVSVGYAHEHSDRETLDTIHVSAVLAACIAMDQTALLVARDPAVHEDDREKWYTHYSGKSSSDYVHVDDLDIPETDLAPETICAACGATADSILAYVHDGETYAVCYDCGEEWIVSPVARPAVPYLDPEFEAVQRALGDMINGKGKLRGGSYAETVETSRQRLLREERELVRLRQSFQRADDLTLPAVKRRKVN